MAYDPEARIKAVLDRYKQDPSVPPSSKVPPSPPATEAASSLPPSKAPSAPAAVQGGSGQAEPTKKSETAPEAERESVKLTESQKAQLAKIRELEKTVERLKDDRPGDKSLDDPKRFKFLSAATADLIRKSAKDG